MLDEGALRLAGNDVDDTLTIALLSSLMSGNVLPVDHILPIDQSQWLLWLTGETVHAKNQKLRARVVSLLNSASISR